MDLKKQLELLNAQLSGEVVEYYDNVTLDWVPLRKGEYVFDFYSVRYRIKPMKTVYMATVRVLLDTTYEGEACDAMTAILTEQMYNPESSLLDWVYERYPTPIKVEDDYTPDVDSLPAWPAYRPKGELEEL